MASRANLVAQPGVGKSVWMPGIGIIYKILPEDTGGALAVIEHPIMPKRLVRPHTHSREDEISYVVEGEIGVRIGDKEIAAGPGTWVFKPRGIRHTFWNPGPKEARLIELITPGAFAYYFEKLASIVGAGGPPDLNKIAELDRSYGVEYNYDWVPDLMARHKLEKLVGDP